MNKTRTEDSNRPNRYIIEIGTGIDLHGQDMNKAAKKAIKDAVSHSCLCGLYEILHLQNADEHVKINITLACSRPYEICPYMLLDTVPVGHAEITAVKGGMPLSGLYAPQFGDKDESIEVVIAALEVHII